MRRRYFLGEGYDIAYKPFTVSIVLRNRPRHHDMDTGPWSANSVPFIDDQPFDQTVMMRAGRVDIHSNSEFVHDENPIPTVLIPSHDLCLRALDPD
jgi:hypothetical protein